MSTRVVPVRMWRFNAWWSVPLGRDANPFIVRAGRMPRLAWILLALCGAGRAVADVPHAVVVEGNGTALRATPLVVDLAATLDLVPGDYRLNAESNGAQILATVYAEDGRRRLAFVLDKLGAGERRTYTLERLPDAGRTGFTVVPGDSGHREVRVDGAPFTTFEVGKYKPYLFPVIGPGGARLTRAFPMEDVAGEERDHPHQRSFWFTHGSVNGLDYWSSDPLNLPNPRFGIIRETEGAVDAAGGALAVVRTRNDWLDPAEKRVLRDTRVYRFWNTPEMRWIDVDVRLDASDGPVTFGDTKEGMFGVRVPSSMDVKREEGGRIVNAEGIVDQAAWGKRSPWVDYSGPVDGKTMGIAVLNHPTSFRHPTPWHVRDYGLFAANPFGYHDFGIKETGQYMLPEGESLVFSYRVVLHAGDAQAAGIAAQYAGYANGPTVRVVAK